MEDCVGFGYRRDVPKHYQRRALPRCGLLILLTRLHHAKLLDLLPSTPGTIVQTQKTTMGQHHQVVDLCMLSKFTIGIADGFVRHRYNWDVQVTAHELGQNFGKLTRTP